MSSALREAAQQALEALGLWATGRDMDAVALNDLILRLEAALENQFNPDWDRTEALQESLREHMAEIHRLRAALAEPEGGGNLPPTLPVEFDHAIGADRFKVVRGAFWWHVLIGDSPTEHGKFRSRASAEKMAADLLREFRNGAFVQHEAALAEPVPDHATIAEWWAAKQAASGEPDMRHPKIQALIGSNARRNIELQLVEQLLDDPDCELTSMDMEYWHGLHDKLREKLTAAAQPAPARVPLTDEQINQITAEQWGAGLGAPYAAYRAYALNAHAGLPMRWLMELTRAIEAAHGIGITAKEAP